MKLRKLCIKNFRGIGYAEIDIEDFTTLVGPNNIGKSTILHAIHLVLDNKKPQIGDWPGQKPSGNPMELICEFSDIQKWEREKSAISKLLYGDALKIRMLAQWNDDQTDYTHEYAVYNMQSRFPWTDENFTNAKKNLVCQSIMEALGISTAALFKDRRQEIDEYALANYPDLAVNSEDWHEKKFANSLQQAVPHVMYVPASFKIEDELKSTASSPFSFLFTKKLFPQVKNDTTYQEYIAKAELLQQKLKGQAGDGSVIDGLGQVLDVVSNTLNQILDFDSKVRLAVGNIDIEPLFMKAATFLIDDEIETSLNYQGSGVQRALAFAMLESNAAVEAEVDGEHRTIVVLYEEPELYIHPHLMRRLKSTLQERSSSVRWQVICSTHSPFLINLADKPESLKLIKRDSGNQRKVHQVSSSVFEVDGEYDERVALRAALDFHPTVCECLFAKRAIIVEGDTEVAVFSMVGELAKKLNLNTSLHKDTTIVSAGGKWTIPAIAKVLNVLDIEYRIIHDADKKGMSPQQLESLPPIHPYKANAKIAHIVGGDKIYVVEDTFEHVIWDSAQGDTIKATDKPFRSWERVRKYINGDIILSKKCEDTLKEIIEFAFS